MVGAWWFRIFPDSTSKFSFSTSRVNHERRVRTPLLEGLLISPAIGYRRDAELSLVARREMSERGEAGGRANFFKRARGSIKQLTRAQKAYFEVSLCRCLVEALLKPSLELTLG